MRSLLALSCATLLLSVCPTAGGTEKRTFVIANSPNDYGVDQCLASGAACGAAAAAAYCKSKHFSAAGSYGRINRDEITGAVRTSASCGRRGCDEFVSIECMR
jgi:hypothetical protein